ncbi:MAG: hypothetical protein JXB18_07805 [Sedimentisphaerales bacterium]|nr:hypothetical protein [Sedimentisphaerales bacterium]
MKKWIYLIMLICPGGLVYANPHIHLTAYIPDMIKIGFSIGAEVFLLTLVMMFFDLAPIPQFWRLLAANLGVYFLVFIPLLNLVSSLWISEIAIVSLDGVLIKLISLSDGLQGDMYRPIKWRYVFLFAAMGNSVSYAAGLFITMR